MWGMEPNKLSSSIGARIPVRINKDTRYFTDEFQALPKNGYTKMVSNMLDHPLIEVCLNTNYEKGMENDYDHAFLCIPIDQFFDLIWVIQNFQLVNLILKNWNLRNLKILEFHLNLLYCLLY